MTAAVEALVPPHSEAAEQSVLGALLMDNQAWPHVGDILQPADFYVAGHGAIFAAIGKLLNSLRPADVVTVFEATQVDLGYLNQLAGCVPGSANLRAWAETVRDRAVRRRLMQLGRELADQAQRGSPETVPIEGLIDGAVTQLLALQQGTARTEPRGMDANLREFINDLNDRAEGAGRTLQTGLRDLDRLTAGGGRRGELWVFGARPSMGKSALVLHLCRQVGQAHQVLLLTQEDSNLMATQRFVAAAGAVNLADLRNPKGATASMWEGVTDGVEALMPLSVDTDDQTGLTMADVRRKAQQVLRRRKRLDLLVVDYLQLMDCVGENRSQALGAAAYGLQKLAKELNCWVVLLSQLSRKADERSGPPQMGDLRESGDIEGAAHLIGMLHREFMRKPTEENKHWAQLHVAKQKNGPTDTINLFFDGAYQRFDNWDGQAPFRSTRGGASSGAD